MIFQVGRRVKVYPTDLKSSRHPIVLKHQFRIGKALVSSKDGATILVEFPEGDTIWIPIDGLKSA